MCVEEAAKEELNKKYIKKKKSLEVIFWILLPFVFTLNSIFML